MKVLVNTVVVLFVALLSFYFVMVSPATKERWGRMIHFDSKQKQNSILLKKAEAQKAEKKQYEYRKDRGKNLTSPNPHWRQGQDS